MSAKVSFELSAGESATFAVTIPKTASTALKLLFLPLRSITLAETELQDEGLTPLMQLWSGGVTSRQGMVALRSRRSQTRTRMVQPSRQ